MVPIVSPLREISLYFDVRKMSHILHKQTCAFDKGSRPYQSDNAQCQSDVMFLNHPPTYHNVERCSLHLEKVYMSLQ